MSSACSCVAASANHHDLSSAGLADAARSAAAAVEMPRAQVNVLAQKEGLILIKAQNETGFEGVRFKPEACGLLCKPFKAHYKAGGRIEHLGYFSSGTEGALAYARRLGPEASKAAAAAAAAARKSAPRPTKKQKVKAEQEVVAPETSGCSQVGGSSGASRGNSCAGSSGASGGTARLPAAARRAAPPPTESTACDPAAKLRGQLTEERLALMTAIMHARTLAAGSGAGGAPTAKELHAAVGGPTTTVAAVKKAMSLLVAMQRAGVPLPGAGEPS